MRSGPRRPPVSTAAPSMPWRAARARNHSSSSASTGTSDGRHPAEDGPQSQHDLPLLGTVAGVEDRRGPAGDRPQGEAPEGLVAVGLLEEGEARQDDVGVAGGLVEVVVDADHGVEQGEGGVEPGGIGRGEHRVPGDGDQPPHPALAGRLDLLGEARQRGLAQDLRRPTDPGPPPGRAQRPAPPGGGGDGGDGRSGEQRAALHPEVAREHVHHLDQPGGQRAELLVAQADAAVDDGPPGAGQLAGEPPDPLGVDAAPRGDRLRGEGPRRVEDLGDAAHPPLDRAEVAPAPRRRARAPRRAAGRRRCPGRSAATRRPARRCRCGGGRPRSCDHPAP